MAVKPPVIGGKYTLLRRLGHGGMAEVFLAKQSGDGGFEKLVVLKRILPHLSQSGEFAAMFLDEARVAADLRHPNVVNIVDVGRLAGGDAPDILFMVMEFLHGQDVRKLQRKVAAFGQMIPLGQACQVAVDAAAGLHYAHAKKDLAGKPLQIVHRDVSPQNILVTFEGGTKIVDFGIAKATGQSTHTSTGVLKGKYTYMSPEQAEGLPVDARTDQFALGIVLWELLTMRRLFKRDTEILTLEAITEGPIPRPRRFREDCPGSIEEVVMTALARDKTKRFRDCEEMAMGLEDALAKEGIVHSQSRLSQYMRRLFADQLAEEASLGVVQPDGSLSAKSSFPVAEKRKEAPEEKIEREPEKKAVVDVEPPPEPAEPTTADRKRARSKAETDTATGARDKDKDKEKPRAKPAPPEKPALEPRSSLPIEKPRDRARDRVPTVPDRVTKTRANQQRRNVIAAAAAAAGGAVVVVVVLIAGLLGSGPANLVVRSEPKGAHVFLDDTDTTQETPALLKGVASGQPHKIRLELEGHQSLSEVVQIPRAGETQELKLELKPKAGLR